MLEFVWESTAWLDVLQTFRFGVRDPNSLYAVQQELERVRKSGIEEIEKNLDWQKKNPDEAKALSDSDMSLYRTQAMKNQQIASAFRYYSLSRH